MSDETYLRSKARRLIEDGKVPNRRPQRMWGGAGLGELCVLCEGTVKQNEVALEVEFLQADGAGPISHHFHLSCYSVMDFELRQSPGADSGALSIEARLPDPPASGALSYPADPT